MTDLLKRLLHSYGLLYVTITQLQSDRPGRLHDSLQKYDESLGPVENGEPLVVVRVSNNGEARIVQSSATKNATGIDESYDCGDAMLMELPEDEFYFFGAFRPGLFNLYAQLPSFLFQMALVYAYTLFESYLSEVVRLRYRAYPALTGMGKHVTLSEVIASSSKENLLETIVDREVDRLVYEPISGVLETLRTRLGFRTLTTSFDRDIRILSYTRNCIVHNSAMVDSKLAAAKPSLSIGQGVQVDLTTVSVAIHMCRKFATAIDRCLEGLQQGHNGNSAC